MIFIWEKENVAVKLESEWVCHYYLLMRKVTQDLPQVTPGHYTMHDEYY